MQSAIRTFQESFSPLKIRNFRIYLGGQAVSLIGTWLQMTAQGWVVWELTHSQQALGYVAMLGTLPMLLLGPWAGVWADRLDRRKVLIGTQIGAMLLAFILALLIWTNTIQIWHIYVLSLLLGVVTTLDLPAQQAFLGDLSGMGEIRKAVNLNAMIIQISRIAGPAIAGFIVGAVGAGTAFGLNGLSFIAVIFSLLAITSHQVRKPNNTKPLVQFREGLRFIGGKPRIQDLIIFSIFITFFGFPVITMFPAIAGDMLHGDPTTLGWLGAASGVGALIAVIFVVPLTQSLRRTGLVLAVATIWLGAWLVLLSFTNQLLLSLLTIFMFSIAMPTVMTMALGLIQLMTPGAMRARVLSVFVMLTFGMQPFASLLMGFLAERFGTAPAIMINGVLLMIGTALMFTLRPELRRWEVDHRSGEMAESREQELPLAALEM